MPWQFWRFLCCFMAGIASPPVNDAMILLRSHPELRTTLASRRAALQLPKPEWFRDRCAATGVPDNPDSTEAASAAEHLIVCGLMTVHAGHTMQQRGSWNERAWLQRGLYESAEDAHTVNLLSCACFQSTAELFAVTVPRARARMPNAAPHRGQFVCFPGVDLRHMRFAEASSLAEALAGRGLPECLLLAAPEPLVALALGRAWRSLVVLGCCRERYRSSRC